MADLAHDINVLVSLARVDGELARYEGELARIPGKLPRIERELATLEKAEKKAIESFEEKAKERRNLERTLQDDEAHVDRLKSQLMSAESNKAYQAFLKEIDTLKEKIDTAEERLLELMDELDDRKTDHDAELARLAKEKKEKRGEIDRLNERAKQLEADIRRLKEKKPSILNDIEPGLKKKYGRLNDSLGGTPVVRVESDSCGGCHSRLPQQLILEIRHNDKLITCEACGRILVHYAD